MVRSEEAKALAKGLARDAVEFLQLSAVKAAAHIQARIYKVIALGVSIILLMIGITAVKRNYIELPSIKLDYHNPPYNASKVALLVENRPDPLLAPVMLQFMSVVPPDWTFRFMGTEESLAHIGKSKAIQHQVSIGKLQLSYIPENMTTNGGEEISRFFTSKYLYETLLAPAEHLLVFQTDSILCTRSGRSIDELLEYDWVGAPWAGDRSAYGGNGGLSLRKVSTMIKILQHQHRIDNTDPEDWWLSERVGHRPGAKVANGTVELAFSNELSRSKRPMGFHIGGSGHYLHGKLLGLPSQRKETFEYCPEVKQLMPMDMAGYMPGDCNAKFDDKFQVNSKRSIEDEEYWPANVIPW